MTTQLLDNSRLSARELAGDDFSKRQVLNALESLALAGLVNAKKIGNRNLYSIPSPKSFLKFLDTKLPTAFPWAEILHLYLELERFLASAPKRKNSVNHILGSELWMKHSELLETRRMRVPVVAGESLSDPRSVDVRWLKCMLDTLIEYIESLAQGDDAIFLK